MLDSTKLEGNKTTDKANNPYLKSGLKMKITHCHFQQEYHHLNIKETIKR